MKKNCLVSALALTFQLGTVCQFVEPANAESPKTSPSEKQSQNKDDKLVWHGWDDAIFDRAKKENKFVLLDLEAVWCHWCHVMEEDTYKDKRVIDLLNSKYITVKVDQDSRPDLSHKYEDYGWPATIIFGPNGEEIVKRAGYINPDKMVKLLQAVIKDPSPVQYDKPVTSYSKNSVLDKALRQELEKKHVDGYDTKYGAWGKRQKFLDWDSVEYAMEKGLSADAAYEKRARQTLTAQLNLLDPVWGGVYQYSTDGDWNHPHFEKIMQMQAENMRVYALGFMLYGDQTYLKAAESIAKYLNDFLTSPDGAFYTSQDADLVAGEHSGEYFLLDDAQRRKQGIPRVDKHIYARENFWAINALTRLYMATGDKKYLERATRAANWLVANRAFTPPAGKTEAHVGGFRHDEKDAAGPYLGDTLAAGRAFLSLYEATADRNWLNRASQAADFMKQFDNVQAGRGKSPTAGYVTALSNRKVARPEPLLDENVAMARFANLLYRYTGKQTYKAMADQALRYLVTPQIARQRSVLVAGILMADSEIARTPVHVTIVGAKSDPAASELFRAALKSPTVYRRVEWFDRKEGNLPNMDVEYPALPKAAAFSCGDGICSSPAYDAAALKKMVTRRSSM